MQKQAIYSYRYIYATYRTATVTTAAVDPRQDDGGSGWQNCCKILQSTF